MPTAHCSTRGLRTLQWAAALLLVGGAQAATVYRCGSVYQDSPCDGAKRMEVADERSAAQQRQREQEADAERRLAGQLAAERQQRERALRPQTEAVGLGSRRAPAQAGSTEPLAGEPDDNPCTAARRARSGPKKTVVKCRNGQPVYLAVPASAPR